MLTEQQKIEILQLYKDPLKSANDVAKEVGCWAWQVINWLKFNKIRIRSESEVKFNKFYHNKIKPPMKGQKASEEFRDKVSHATREAMSRMVNKPVIRLKPKVNKNTLKARLRKKKYNKSPNRGLLLNALREAGFCALLTGTSPQIVIGRHGILLDGLFAQKNSQEKQDRRKQKCYNYGINYLIRVKLVRKLSQARLNQLVDVLRSCLELKKHYMEINYG